jgi:hypothetical protein
VVAPPPLLTKFRWTPLLKFLNLPLHTTLEPTKANTNPLTRAPTFIPWCPPGRGGVDAGTAAGRGSPPEGDGTGAALSSRSREGRERRAPPLPRLASLERHAPSPVTTPSHLHAGVQSSKYKVHRNNDHIPKLCLKKYAIACETLGFCYKIIVPFTCCYTISTTTTATKAVEGRLQLTTRRVRLAPPPHLRTEGSGVPACRKLPLSRSHNQPMTICAIPLPKS